MRQGYRVFLAIGEHNNEGEVHQPLTDSAQTLQIFGALRKQDDNFTVHVWLAQLKLQAHEVITSPHVQTGAQHG